MEEEKKYLRISESILKKIQSGELPPGSRLPTYRRLAADFHTTQVTLANAIRELETQGWLRRHPGKGVFIENQETDMDPGKADGKRHHQVGLILGEGDDLFSNLRASMASVLEPCGRYLVSLCSLEPMTFMERDKRIRSFVENDFESLVVYGSRHNRFRTLRRLLRKIRQLNFVVFQETELDFPGANLIAFDYREAGRIAARHLISCGQRRLGAIVPGPLSPAELASNGGMDIGVNRMLEGFSEVLADAGIDPRTLEILHSPLYHDSPTEFHNRLEKFCRNGRGGIFAAGDSYLPSVYRTAHTCKARIGEDLHLIGLYNTGWGAILYPELTSICIREHEIGKAAAECILNHAENEEIILKPYLIKRQT